MNHPAGEGVGVGKAAVWYGREVEGRVALGAQTAFVDSWPSVAIAQELLDRVLGRDVHHVFFTENFRAWGELEHMLGALLTEPVKLTIACYPHEVHEIMKLTWIRRASLMVRASMDAPWVSHLRLGDQVSVGVPYDLITWTVADGQHSYPEDYLGDKLC